MKKLFLIQKKFYQTVISLLIFRLNNSKKNIEMRFVEEYLRDEYRVKPLGTITTKPYEADCGEYTGEEILVDGKPISLIVYYIDYINWLEKTSL